MSRSKEHSCECGDLPASAVSVKSSVKPPSPMKAPGATRCARPFRSSTRTHHENKSEDAAHTTAACGLVVRWVCSAAWRCKSSAQPDGGEGLVKRKGYRREAASEESVKQTCESMNKQR